MPGLKGGDSYCNGWYNCAYYKLLKKRIYGLRRKQNVYRDSLQAVNYLRKKIGVCQLRNIIEKG